MVYVSVWVFFDIYRSSVCTVRVKHMSNTYHSVKKYLLLYVHRPIIYILYTLYNIHYIHNIG